MSPTLTQKNADVIAVSISDIREDIAFIDDLKRTCETAKSRGVRMGTVTEELEEQRAALLGKINTIDQQIHDALYDLVLVEQSIRKKDSRLDLSFYPENSDKFKLVYDRLSSDRASLDHIVVKIGEWNIDNNLSIDDSSVKNLRDDIDNALDSFDTSVSDCAEDARNYAKIVDDTVSSPASSDVDMVVADDNGEESHDENVDNGEV